MRGRYPCAAFSSCAGTQCRVAPHTQLVEAYKASGRLDQEMDFSGGSV